jgi:DNA-directed RNA polymerase specialized sigma24 family protein
MDRNPRGIDELGAFAGVARAWEAHELDRARLARPDVPLDESFEVEAPETEPPRPVDAQTGCIVRVLAERLPDDADILRTCELEGRTQRAFEEVRGLGLPAVESRLLPFRCSFVSR